MEDIKKENNQTTDLAVPENKETALAIDPVNVKALDKESVKLINELIAENDMDKVKDLTYLFNVNQNKKTLARNNKLNELMDSLTGEAMNRVNNRPDEITSTELFNMMKITQELMEKGQKQASGITDTAPLIQINQQTNTVNTEGKSFTKESRNKIQNAVSDILKTFGVNPQATTEETVVDGDVIITKEDDEDD